MRSPAALLALAAVLGAAACTADDRHTLPDPAGPPVAATLTTTFTRAPGHLTWAWTLRNDEPRDIAVFSGTMAGDDGSGSSADEGAWVVPRDSRTVEVSQRLLGPAPNVGLARYHSQYGTVLATGTEVSGTATVRLPLRLSHPYASAFEPALALPDEPDRVIFCVGVGRAADHQPMSRPSASAAPGLYTAADGTAPAHARKALYLLGQNDRQHLVCARPEEL
ncbi:hypothetical protein [Spirilliplanes yamanashiensis]|uniref:Uncharacterized protein n=1 Tax=Spirilliplanes yamanashiensis TaxID=42233 RepID=A0A8J3YDB5_9ACTN|nr:hypothetical protein [Spirilliplanes yamanashiensis]MDP9816095.1 hypothetical protein [Spirilliplanes yamanashiensis]GIJ05618.1 hypothetical protein Sya03_49700 [Spirilliplanes yamanashiensis]